MYPLSACARSFFIFVCASLFLWYGAFACAAQEETQQLLDQAYCYEQKYLFDKAIDCYTKLLAQDQDNAAVLFDMARCCYMQGRYEESSHFFLRTFSYCPANKKLLLNANQAICKLGRFDKSIQILEQGLALFPNDQDFVFQLQWRYMQAQQLDLMTQRWPTFKDCCWQNMNVRGKKIFLPLLDPGMGDIFMFLRGAKWLHDAGAYVIVQTWPRLVPFIDLCPFVDEVVTQDISGVSDATYSMGWQSYCYFMDQALRNPQRMAEPYLCADPALIGYWRNRCADDPHIKIGLCWLSSFVIDSLDRCKLSPRAVPPRDLEQLGTVDGVSFYSLQQATDRDYAPPSFVRVFDNLDSVAFMDTAAIIKNLDLVITVDTSIAHLAGALGVRVWLLLNIESDVRWFLDRIDSPWYPTMRIFRQHTLGDWESVIQEIKQALELLKQGFNG